MDYTSVLVAAVLGGSGALTGVLLARTFTKGENSPSGKILVAICAGLFVAAGQTVFKSQDLKDMLVPPSAVELKLREMTSFIKSDSRLMNEFKGLSADKARTRGAQLTANGMQHLGFSELLEWHKIRGKLANSDKNICAGFWTGNINRLKYIEVLGTLNKESLDRWFELSKKAMLISIDRPEPIEVNQNLLEKAFLSIMELLPESDQARYASTLQSGVSAIEKDACWIMKILFSKLESIPKDQQKSLLIAFTQ